MAIFAHIKIEHKETQTDQGQLIFYLTSTEGSLFSIILCLRIVWRLKRLDPKRVTAIYRRYYWCSFSVIVIFWKLTSCQNEREALRREGFCNNLHSTFHLAEYLYWANKCNANLPLLWAGGSTLTKHAGTEKKKFPSKHSWKLPECVLQMKYCLNSTIWYQVSLVVLLPASNQNMKEFEMNS